MDEATEAAEVTSWLAQYGDGVGVVGIAVLIIVCLATGLLYTRRQHDSIVRLLERESDKKDTIIETQAEQINSLLEGGAITKDFFEKVPVVEAEGGVPPTRARKAPPKQGAKT